jgi:hypothetical protein
VSETFGRIREYVAEADHFVSHNRKHLWKRAIDHASQEGTGLLEREPVNGSQVPLFRRDRIDGVTARRRIRFTCWSNLHSGVDLHHSILI